MVTKGQIGIEVLKDGSLKIETGDMSGPLHKDADDLLTLIQTLMGGSVEKKSLDHGHHHHHEHDHDHEHDHHHH
jgi:hypothetical protein